MRKKKKKEEKKKKKKKKRRGNREKGENGRERRSKNHVQIFEKVN